MLFGEAVGMILVSLRPAAENKSPNSASVRRLAPECCSSISTSNDLAGLGSLPGGRTISTASTFPWSGVAAAQFRRIVAGANAGEPVAPYRRRLAELDRELAAALTAADAKRARRLERERGALGAELERASGPGHRSRPLGASTVERAGKAVTARIRDAIRLIKAVIPSSVRA